MKPIIQQLREEHTQEVNALKTEIKRLQGELTEHTTIQDRPLDDDLNELLHRCETWEPLSLADQRELFEWLQERDVIIGDYDEKIKRLWEALVPFATAAKHMTAGKRCDPRESGVWTAPDRSCRLSVADIQQAAEALNESAKLKEK